MEPRSSEYDCYEQFTPQEISDRSSQPDFGAMDLLGQYATLATQFSQDVAHLGFGHLILFGGSDNDLLVNAQAPGKAPGNGPEMPAEENSNDERHVRLQALAPDQQARVGRLIQDLSSDNFRIREQASRELLEVGLEALPFIQQALRNSNDLEVTSRLERIWEHHVHHGLVPTNADQLNNKMFHGTNLEQQLKQWDDIASNPARITARQNTIDQILEQARVGEIELTTEETERLQAERAHLDCIDQTRGELHLQLAEHHFATNNRQAGVNEILNAMRISQEVAQSDLPAMLILRHGLDQDPTFMQKLAETPGALEALHVQQYHEAEKRRIEQQQNNNNNAPAIVPPAVAPPPANQAVPANPPPGGLFI